MFWTPVRYSGALHLSGIDLWLDARSRREWAFISHAHSDHIARHDEAIVSEETYRYLCHRRFAPGSVQILPFLEPRVLRGVTFTLFPAGHMLGSAQLLAVIGDQRLLYSGDFKLRPNHAAESIVVPQADVLIMETTFGHARYRFPPADTVISDIVAWCDGCLLDGVTPVLLAYSLGKSQELLAALGDRGYHFLLHDAIYQATRLADECGVTFPNYERWSPGTGDGAVVFCPPHLRKWLVSRLPPCRTALVSGWAFDPSARFRYGADAAFCLSDHADHADLLTYVSRVHPHTVYTVHGAASEFAATLRRQGYTAHALDEPDQLSLF